MDGLSIYDDLLLNLGDKLKIQRLKINYMKKYNPIHPEEAEEMRNKYHEEAEKIRAKYGYSGGIDGNCYMPICRYCSEDCMAFKDGKCLRLEKTERNA